MRRTLTYLTALLGAVGLTACTTTAAGNGGQSTTSAVRTSPTSSASSSAPAPPSSSASTKSTMAAPPSSASSSPPPSWSATFDAVSSGVVRIDVANCTEAATGAGFLVAPTLVATVAHVVEGMDSIRVTDPALSVATSASVLGFSHDHDLALLQLDHPIDGHDFTLTATEPSIGTEIAAIGFPLGRSEQLTIGHITGIHDHRVVGDSSWQATLSDVVLSDAALNPGNSGGPWLTQAGDVVALDESGPPTTDASGSRAEGNNGGVSAADAISQFAQWKQARDAAAAGQCAPQSPVAAAEQTLTDYFFQINESDYASAYAQLDPGNHPTSGLNDFISGVETSTDTAPTGLSDLDYSVSGAGRTSSGQTYIDAVFQSKQDPDHGNGSACTNWTLRYLFSSVNGLELIESSPASPGTPGRAPC